MTSRLRRHGPPAILAALLLALCPAALGAVQFRLLGWASADVNLQFDGGAQATEAVVYTDSLSPLYEYKRPGPLVLYKNVELDGRVVRQTACTVAIPPDAGQGLVILMPGDDAKAASRKVLPNQFGFVSGDAPMIYDYVWLDDSHAARPSGTLEFRNFSRHHVALQVERHQLQLAPGERAQVPLAKGAKRMAFKAAAQVNGAWKVFATNPLPTRNPDRLMIILRDHPADAGADAPGDEPRIQMISLRDDQTPVAMTPASSVATR